MEKIIEFIKLISLLDLALIFIARIVEVSMGTLRVILINKGYRKLGVVLAFFEVVIWIFVASSVISGINETSDTALKAVKGIVYSLGFASGVYLGSKIESRLAFGKVLIQVITSKELGATIAFVLRNQKLGVTTIDAQGKDDQKMLLMLYANRRGQEQVVEQIKTIDQNALIVSNDVSSVSGGYINKFHGFVK